MSGGDKVTTVLMGNGSLLIQCGDVLVDRGHAISAVVTSSDQVSAWARKSDIRVIAPDADLGRAVSDLDFDWFFSIANLRIVPEAVWQRATKGAANFHDGPLPRHAGLNAPAWAILAGEQSYGVTWHAMTSAVDEGDVYTQSLFEIGSDETSITLNTKCFEAGISTFIELIGLIENGAPVRRRQDLTERTYHERLKRPARAATLDFSGTCSELSRLARALSFGSGYANPLSLPKIWCQRRAYNVVSMEVDQSGAAARPGTVIAVDAASAIVACADGAVRITGLTDQRGRKVALLDVLRPGDQLEPLPASTGAAVEATQREIARSDAFFERRLRRFRNLEIQNSGDPGDDAPPEWQVLELAVPAEMSGDRVLAGVLAGLARVTDQDSFDVLYCDDQLGSVVEQQPGYVADAVPFAVEFRAGSTAREATEQVRREIADLRRRIGCAGDLVSRQPRLGFPDATIAVRLAASPSSSEPVAASAITFVIAEDGGACRAVLDCNRLPTGDAKAMVSRLSVALAAFAASDALDVARIPLMTADEEAELLHTRNATGHEYDRSALVHELIEAQARRTPNAVAIVCGSETLTYRELDEKATRVARRLTADGVAPDSLVGLYLQRSCDLVVGALAILKAGGAYVPLDPSYPAERLSLMIEDSDLRILIADRADAPVAQRTKVSVLTIEAAMAGADVAAPKTANVRPDNLAYVIYTSGSTGRPKGVMIEHRNVINFFAGMDDRVPRAQGTQPVWLAVTSLSFDISVLELFWTLARGFKVVIIRDARSGGTDAARSVEVTEAGRHIDFGLFYWGDDDGAGAEKYRLLLEGARLADDRGFNAVWTPERHFHAFGGPYPNSSVTGAAVAAITRNVSIRAGSCVLPLHHPARVAEEWAVIDNISRGRAAIAFASGWMPEDFLLRPENAPPNNKAAMLRDIDVVRRLWRGDKVAFQAPSGKQVEITTLPRPIQPELPVWLTTAGNADTYREAGRLGFNVLTHLLGQSISEVGEKIRIYREALVQHGRDPSKFTVTLMLHTLIGHDREAVREMARGPMMRYLRSAVALIKEYAWAFPAFKKPRGVDRPMDLDLKTLDREELDAIVEFAFLRYFDDSGLFGTIDDAIARVNQIAAIGVNEIACLIDFGVSADVALAALDPLAEVVATVQRARAEQSIAAAAETVGALIEAHGVTHLQCTPAMATMLLAGEEDRAALSHLRHMFIGGEALQSGLLKELRSTTAATIENMYGPTETTIWSSTGPAQDTGGAAPLGTPIANTQLYVLDSKLRPVPRGLPGELYIGGEGVARGYHRREDLTRERFLPNPYLDGGRIYRTGDVVRIGKDDQLHYLGRSDHQVKVRGYRIELGEIEACLGLHPGVAQAVVVAREDVTGDVRIVAYVRFKSGKLADEQLKLHARTMLPDFMVPAHFVAIDQWPLTPNAKIDRKALPRPDDATVAIPAVDYAAPDTDVGRQIADVFKGILGVDRVGLNDNFFDLGGHSLLAVQAHRSIKASIGPGLSITDIYRFPTVAGLVRHLREKDGPNRRLDTAAARAAQRRNAMGARRAPVARTDS
jgi:natural product biosynthesis luciferase-like monooxygenase protein